MADRSKHPDGERAQLGMLVGIGSDPGEVRRTGYLPAKGSHRLHAGVEREPQVSSAALEQRSCPQRQELAEALESANP